MVKITITKGAFPSLFGGFGFHNNDAGLYGVMEREHFNQVICKNYRELSPGFMRTFAGYYDWTKEAMDRFAEYYEKMQKWTDTPMYFAAAKGELHFSDEDMRQYCEDVAENLAYLINEKGVKHLRYYCFSNEMSQCGWGNLMENLPLFKKYHEMLYRAIHARKLNVGLLATDASEYENWNTVDWAIENMARITEDYCVHIYERQHDIYDLGFYDFFYGKCREIADKAIRSDGKRVILGEFGITKVSNLKYCTGAINDTCHYFYSGENAYSALMLTEMVFAAVNAGVFALAMWSFTDYPDPYSCAYGETGYAKAWGEAEKFISGTTDVKYNKWGLTKWEDDGDYSARDFYWCIGLICKYLKRNSKVLDIGCEDKNLRICAIMNKDSSISIGIVNRNKTKTEIAMDIGTLAKKPLRVYVYDSNNVPRNRFCDLQDYSVILEKSNPVKYTLLPDSVTVLTTDYIERDDPVYAAGLKLKDGYLTWKEVNDDTHCYYRVFAGKDRSFTPSRQNQIASTVACSLPVKDQALCYKVLSVDKSGNCFGK